MLGLQFATYPQSPGLFYQNKVFLYKVETASEQGELRRFNEITAVKYLLWHKEYSWIPGRSAAIITEINSRSDMLVMESQGSLNLNDHTHQVASSLSFWRFLSPLEKSVFLFPWEGPVLWWNSPPEGAGPRMGISATCLHSVFLDFFLLSMGKIFRNSSNTNENKHKD